MHIQAISAFEDNYIWLITVANHRAIVVDPGDAAPVEQFLTQHDLSLAAILITHHHADHTGGLPDLLVNHDVPVFGPPQESIPGVSHPVSAGQYAELIDDFESVQVLDTGGHTPGHISYLIDGKLFCGDTLFAGGCGRLLGGTATQLFASLTQLKALPDATEIYCAHEYTLANLRFAQAVEPANAALQSRVEQVERLRHKGRITLPSTLEIEKQTNPFLRCETPTVKAAAEAYADKPLPSAVEVFTVIRRWKDQF